MRRRPLRGADGEGGQLLLLAGIILVLAFVTTALTLGQVAEIEKQATNDQQSPILAEYRFIREKAGSTMRDAVTGSTDNATFIATFESMAETFKRMAQEKGYDLLVYRAEAGIGLNRTEWSYTDFGWPDRMTNSSDIGNWKGLGATKTFENGGVPYAESIQAHREKASYWLRSTDDLVKFGPSETKYGSAERVYDRTDDGIVWVKPCPLFADPTRGCIQAAIVYLYLADATTSIEEYVVYSFNQA